MKKKLLLGLTFLIAIASYGQKYEARQGDVNNLLGIKQYKVVFEYAEALEIPTYSSEEAFITTHIEELKNKKDVDPATFRALWFKNRETIYEPTFIKEFNDFRLGDRHVAVSRNYEEARHSMLVKVKLVYPGYEGFIWDKAARLEVTIHFTDSESPNVILFATETVKVHGQTKGDLFDKITTAYGELGRWTAKFLCRKT
jgi:hypothetical protein